MVVEGQLVDVWKRSIYPASIDIRDGKIFSIERKSQVPAVYVLPGFVDAHVHIESSMVIPSRFAEVALRHGTLAVVSDPHEIANVLGTEGILFMVEDGQRVPFKFFFGVPSCVPATPFETSGSIIDAYQVKELLKRDDMFFLAEMMNYPGVVSKDPEVLAKIMAAREVQKPVDGHAPGLRGDDLRKYIAEGISTDHECASLEEAKEKIALGMKILIRQGSAARNLEDLLPLLKTAASHIMFCTDDCHPDDFVQQHINEHVMTALNAGYDLFDVLQAACVNPVIHYRLPVGLLREGDPADFIVVEDLHSFKVLQVYVNGQLVYDGKLLFEIPPSNKHVNRFYINPVEVNDLDVLPPDCSFVNVIEVVDGQLYTKKKEYPVSDLSAEKGINKAVVISRYAPLRPSVGFVLGFQLQRGAIATSVAHDSHNIIAVGADDSSIVKAIRAIQDMNGGMVVCDGYELFTLPLPVAGLMSNERVEVVAEQYKMLNKKAFELGIPLRAPFMTLSFLSLLVIPELKLGDRGLFDVTAFKFTDLCVRK